MSTNCLVTKLKGVVDNDNLMKIGEWDINLPAGSSITLSRNWINNPVTVAIKSGTATAVDENNNPISFPDVMQPSELSTKNHTFTATTNCVLCVTKVYNFTTITCATNRYWDVDVEVFKYSPITWFSQGGNTQIHGDIKHVIKLGNRQTNIVFGDANLLNNLYGDLSVFGNCLSLSTLDVRFQSGINGSVESMVSKFRENGRTTGSMTISVPTSGIITFNSAGITGSNKTLSWDATTITYDGTTITA